MHSLLSRAHAPSRTRRTSALGRALALLTATLAAGCIGENLGWKMPAADAGEGSSSDVTSGQDTRDATSDTSGDGTQSTSQGASDGSSSSVGSASSGEGTSTSYGGSSSSSPETGGCFEESIPIDILPPDIVFVLDKSYSMKLRDYPSEMGADDVWFHWSSLRNAVLEKIGEIEDKARIGAILTPAQDAEQLNPNACEIGGLDEFPLTMGAYNGFNLNLPDSLEFVGGGRPLGQGVSAARQMLAQDPGEGLQFIVLVTNGAPNCDTNLDFPAGLELYYGLAEQEISEAYDEGIVTLVIGLGVTELDGELPYAPDGPVLGLLNNLAIAGGVYDAGEEDQAVKTAEHHVELVSHMQIVDQFANCITRVPPTFSDVPDAEFSEFVEVLQNGQVLEQLPGCTGDGYIVRTITDEVTIMAFCGAPCDAWKDGFAPIMTGCI